MGNEEWVRIELERSGGLLGAPRTFAVDVNKLGAQDATEIARLAERVLFFDLPGEYPHSGLPDAFEYRFTITSAAQAHTVVFHDQDGHPDILDEIVDWVVNRQGQGAP
jgi:hypothetical protein